MNTLGANLFSGALVAAAALIGRSGGLRNPRTMIWYAGLEKPAITPPGAIIGAAWTTLDGLLTLSGGRLLAAPPGKARRSALFFWTLNLAGVAGFPWLLFKQKQLGSSALAVAAMMASARCAVATAGKVDRIAAVAGMPLIGWLGFAGFLSEELWRRNRNQTGKTTTAPIPQ